MRGSRGPWASTRIAPRSALMQGVLKRFRITCRLPQGSPRCRPATAQDPHGSRGSSPRQRYGSKCRRAGRSGRCGHHSNRHCQPLCWDVPGQRVRAARGYIAQGDHRPVVRPIGTPPAAKEQAEAMADSMRWRNKVDRLRRLRSRRVKESNSSRPRGNGVERFGAAPRRLGDCRVLDSATPCPILKIGGDRLARIPLPVQSSLPHLRTCRAAPSFQ